ncbi:MAG: carbohydrate-binding family 9-like protein [Clostridium sp.]|jgi:hypothetical protein|nr:carbohydrate-binding family 9-like protein [Clostridium sp.]
MSEAKLLVPLYPRGTLPGEVTQQAHGSLEHWHWEGAEKYRPKTSFELWAVEDEALYVKLSTREREPRALYTERDQPVYEDSCLEVFLQPRLDDKRYINLESNANSTLWSAIGERRDGRRFLRELADPAAIASPENFVDKAGGLWGLLFTIPLGLLKELYGADFSFHDGQAMRGNFYKCGDKTPLPHWGAWRPVTENPPGFHNPECFGNIILREVR